MKQKGGIGLAECKNKTMGLLLLLILLCAVVVGCAPRQGLPQFDEAEQQRVDLLQSQAEELAKLARLAAREERRPVEFQDLVNRSGALKEATATEQRNSVVLQLVDSPEHAQCLTVEEGKIIIGC